MVKALVSLARYHCHRRYDSESFVVFVDVVVVVAADCFVASAVRFVAFAVRFVVAATRSPRSCYS